MERSRIPVRCSALFDITIDIFKCAVPKVSHTTYLIFVYVSSGIEPRSNSTELLACIICGTAKLDEHIEFLFLPSSATTATISFNGILDKGIQEIIESIFAVPCDYKLTPPLAVES